MVAETASVVKLTITQKEQGGGVQNKTQGLKDAKTQGRKDAKTQRRKDAKTQRHKDAKTQRHIETLDALLRRVH